jgi:antibiotic biosynthesis monooxygenase (ABM) superfamily enzyme
MSFINRKWTPAHADEWTKEDWITIIISPLAYVLLSIGIGLSLLLLPVGFIVLAAGIILTIIMHWIIDPKLKTISSEYEKKQKDYLETLERSARWEEHNG